MDERAASDEKRRCRGECENVRILWAPCIPSTSISKNLRRALEGSRPREIAMLVGGVYTQERGAH